MRQVSLTSKYLTLDNTAAELMLQGELKGTKFTTPNTKIAHIASTDAHSSELFSNSINMALAKINKNVLCVMKQR